MPNFGGEHADAALNGRQVKVVKRLLEAGPDGFEGGMTNRKYVGITKVSSDTAKRDLSDLGQQRNIKEKPRRRAKRELQPGMAGIRGEWWVAPGS